MVARNTIDLISSGVLLLFCLSGCGQKKIPHLPVEGPLDDMYTSIRLKDVKRFKPIWSKYSVVDFRSIGYEAPLVYAARVGSVDVLKFLLSHVEYSEMDLESALIASVTQPDVGTVAILFKHVDDTELAKNKDRLLYFAVEAGMTQVGEFLLSAGARPNYVDRRGNTLLHAAASSGKTHFVELLFRAGVDLCRRNSEELTALEVAQRIQGKQSRIVLELERLENE